jgi:hypothetical protein
MIGAFFSSSFAIRMAEHRSTVVARRGTTTFQDIAKCQFVKQRAGHRVQISYTL